MRIENPLYAPLYDLPLTFIEEAQPNPPQWVITNLLPVGLTVMAGPPKKAYKSTMSYALAAMVSEHEVGCFPKKFLEGDSPFFEVRKTGKVLLLSAEADAGEIRFTMEEHLRILPLKPRSIAFADARVALGDTNLADEYVQEKLFKLLDELDARLLIVDPLVKYHRQEERDARGMLDVLAPLQRWAKKNDAAALAVHHVGKTEDRKRDYTPQDVRGSSAILGEADGIHILSPKKEGSILFEAIFKRGSGWKEEIRISAYSGQNLREASPFEQTVLAAFTRHQDYKSLDLAKLLHKNKKTVLDAMHNLVQLGHLEFDKKNKRFIVSPTESD